MSRLAGGAALFLYATAAPLSAQSGLAPADHRDLQTEAALVQSPTGSMLIENLDAVWTAAGPVQHDVSILIQDGIIRAIGSDLSKPAGGRVIDGRGLTAMPGVVDEHSHIAMRGGSNEGTAPVTPEVRVIDALDPGDFGIYQALSGGVTTAQILHGSANPIGGQSAIIKLRWGTDKPYGLLVDGAPRTVKFALGENVTSKNSSSMTNRFPASREGVEAVYEQAFTAAQEYKKAWDEYRRNPSAFPVPPRVDLRLQALVDIMDGRIGVHAHSYRSDEILMLMRVAERFGFRIETFTHVLEGYRVADELREHGAGASTFSDWWGYKLEVQNAIPYNPAILYHHGVVTSLNSDIPWLQSFLLYEMQKPVKYGGVPKEEAIKMLTLNSAKQLRIDHLVGSLEVGKSGDVVLLNGDPFNTFSRVEKTIIDGIVYYDRTAEEVTRHEPFRAIPDAPEVAPPAEHAHPPVTTDLSFDPPSITPEQKLTDPIDRSPVTVITGATVHPVSSDPIENGVVVIENGLIKAVGRAGSVQVPAGARQVDATGKHVYPGMIDPLTSLGLVDVESVPSARDDREVGAYNPHVRSLFGMNMFSHDIPVARANGITSVLTTPATGVIRGSGSVVQLSGDTPEKAGISDRAALVVDFPSPTGEQSDEPSLKGEALQKLVELFHRATSYAANPTALHDPTQRFEVNSDPSDRVLLEAMVPAMRGEIPIIFIASSERDIRSLMMLLDTFPKIDAVLGGGNQAYFVAEELAERDIPVIIGTELTPNDYRDDPVTAAWRNAAILRNAGVKIAFTTSFSPEGVSEIRNLPYEAARAVSYGLSEADGIRALTLSAAEILGLGDRMGSLDAGKRADLIITDGNPMQILTHVDRMWIAGQEMPLASYHTQLYWQFRNRGTNVSGTGN
jgi:imidazolonepropionase-like amidohydrolase